MKKWKDEWKNECMYEGMNEWMDESMNDWMNEWMNDLVTAFSILIWRLVAASSIVLAFSPVLVELIPDLGIIIINVIISIDNY